MPNYKCDCGTTDDEMVICRKCGKPLVQVVFDIPEKQEFVEEKPVKKTKAKK